MNEKAAREYKNVTEVFWSDDGLKSEFFVEPVHLIEYSAVTALVEALEACAPSWLPPEIRLQRRQALEEFRKARGEK